MPRIWLLIGDKLGDNAQVAVLAEHLGLPAERKDLRFKEQWVLGKPRFSASLDHIDLQRSAPLAPPWPDLIITIGRRPAMAALWVKRQSGGRTRIALIGRPKRFFKEFDLVIVTGQYRVPARENVVHLDLPLMRPDAEAIAKARNAWTERLAELPRPLTAVFVGGPTKPFRFDAAEARKLCADVVRATAAAPGSLYFTTSRRTTHAVAAALQAALPAQARLFRWTPVAEENPYLALLAEADRFVVTGDSISMIVEAAQSGRPLAIRPLPFAGGRLATWRQRLQPLLHGDGQGGFAPLQRLGDLLFEAGLAGYSRDFGAFHDLLQRGGYATLLEQGFRMPSRSPRADVERAVAAIRRVLEQAPGSGPQAS